MAAISEHISTPHRFLVIQTAFIGDALLATALLEDLHYAYPNSKIDFLIRQDAAPLFENHPFIHSLLVWNKRVNKLSELPYLAYQIRENHYSAIFNLQRFAATGWLTAQAKAVYTAGFSQSPFASKFSFSVEHRMDFGLHEIERNRLLIKEWVPNATALPKIYPSLEIKKKVKALVPESFIALAIGSVWFTKRTPESIWISFLSLIPKDIPVVFIGGPKEKPMADQLIVRAGKSNAINLCGAISLIESAALIEAAIITYSNDSAPIHLASCVNAPIAALFCNTIPEFGFGPISENKWVIESALDLTCRPCGKTGKAFCPIGNFLCGNSIPVAQMVNAFNEAYQLFRNPKVIL